MPDMDNLPKVSLIKGNLAEEDKQRLINQIISLYEISKFDVLYLESFNVESSQQIQDFIATEPMSNVKLAVIELESSTSRAQNTLLSILEECPDRVRFLIFGNPSTLSTVESRSEVSSVENSSGIDRTSKNQVLSVLSAVASLDEVRLEDLLRNWSDECQKLIVEWAVEKKLSRPRVFSDEELSSAVLPDSFVDNVILSVCMLDFARPRISIKPILLSYIEQSKGLK